MSICYTVSHLRSPAILTEAVTLVSGKGFDALLIKLSEKTPSILVVFKNPI